MAQTLKFGNGTWATKKGSTLAYNDENSNYKPLPFDFSRASKATVINKDGLIEEVGSGEPRIDYLNDSKGALLLEPSRSNIMPYSEDFTQGAWIKLTNSTAIGNVAISPDGTQNSSEIKAVATSTSVLGIQDGFTVSSGITYTVSFFAKKGVARYIQLFHGGGQVTGNARTNFDLEDGVVTVSSVGHTSTIEDFGNGWFRCVVELNTLTTTLQTYFNAVKEPNASRSATSSWSANDNFYLWGAQLEQGYLTSYIPTQGSAVTRIADVCNNGGNEQVINSTEGVLYAEMAALEATSSGSAFITITDGTYNNRASFLFSTGATNQIRTFLRVGGTTQIDVSNSVSDVTDFNKIAFSYKENDFKVYINGALVSSDTNGSVWSTNTINKLTFSEIGTTAGIFKGKVKALAVYKEALTDAELAALTQV